MHHSFIFRCNNCGHEMEVPAGFGNQFDAWVCRECHNGCYVQSGESYDQEFVDEQKYNEQQDREYQERHSQDNDRYY